jgi:hypothetical protein
MRICTAIFAAILITGHTGCAKMKRHEATIDPDLAALVNEIRDGKRAQDTYSPLYTLMMKEDGVNRHSPEEVLPTVNTMLHWAFRNGQLEGMTRESPMPASSVNAYSKTTILVCFDQTGSGTSQLSPEGCYEFASDEFREPTAEEVKAMETTTVSELSKRGYVIARVHHRIRGPIAFIHVDLGALDLTMVFEKKGRDWRLLHPYTVFWGQRSR